MTWDLTTAYHADWQYLDRIEDVTWERTVQGEVVKQDGLKAQFGPIDTPDLVTVAAGLGLSSQAAAVVVWEPKPIDVDLADWEPTFVPMPGHLLRKQLPSGAEPEVGQSIPPGQGWLIYSITKSPFQAKWELLCDVEVTNA